jgi:3-hydroxyisobutyrate dehydrogenase
MANGTTGAATVGVVGLGHMGSLVAERLLEAGHSVRVWDRDEEAIGRLGDRGARRGESPESIAREVDVLFTVLPDDDAVRAVVLEAGLLKCLREGAVFADLSTTSVDLAVELGSAGLAASTDVLDVEMSGSTPQLEHGELTLFVGGDAGVLERVRPVLEPLAKTILHVGGHGAAASMKLVVNLLLGVEMQALAEAIALGEGLGLDRDRLLDGLAQTAVVAPAHRAKLEMARRNDYRVQFALRLMHKDFGLILHDAGRRGVDLPAAAAAAAVCAAELESSREDVDFAAVIRRMEAETRSRPAA